MNKWQRRAEEMMAKRKKRIYGRFIFDVENISDQQYFELCDMINKYLDDRSLKMIGSMKLVNELE